MKRVVVDFKCIAVEGCHQPEQPVIYIVAPSDIHRRDILFTAFANWDNAVNEKKSHTGMHIMEILLETGINGLDSKEQS